jgi:hypothetical protein
MMSCDSASEQSYEQKYQWCLATEAFLGWKELIDAKQKASKAGEKERYHRLSTLSTKAWRRYVRRWSCARSLPLEIS